MPRTYSRSLLLDSEGGCRELIRFGLLQNITSFLTRQNAQFDEAFNQLEALRNGLDATRSARILPVRRDRYPFVSKLTLVYAHDAPRVRNPDLLTALDLLTTGTYQRLPQRFQVHLHLFTIICSAQAMLDLPSIFFARCTDVAVHLHAVLRPRRPTSSFLPRSPTSPSFALCSISTTSWLTG